MKAPARRFDLLLSVADLDAAAWLWTAIAGVAPAVVERDGRRELHLESTRGRVRLVASGAASRVVAVQPLELTVPAAALPELLRAAEQAGFAHAVADDRREHVVTIRAGVSLVLHVQPEPEAPPPPASLVLPPGRLVRRAPRAEAPRAKRPGRKNPEAGRAVPESSARAPRRIVRPRGQVRKVGKK